MNSKEFVVHAEGLTLGHPGQLIASDITLDIRPGEWIGIFGANGSGKTTFLKALLGLIRPWAGQLSVLGASPKHGNPEIGYMPQMRSHPHAMHFNSRAIVMASIHCTRFGWPRASAEQKKEAKTLLDWVGAWDYADRPFFQLSGGERQRAYLAQALLGRPKILLLDEPLSGLDPRFQDTFIQLLSAIQKKYHPTVLVTAHDPNPLLKVMDRVLYFANQKIALGPTKEVMTSEKLSALYGSPIEVIHHRGRLIVLGEERESHHD